MSLRAEIDRQLREASTRTVDVEALPRRVAHVVHALLEAQGPMAHGPMPLRCREVMEYDGEALTARATGRALQRARDRGLAQNWGSLWSPTFLASHYKRQFEDRYLRETEHL
jgi:hypothetical protein